jgi:hypothetical protein
MLLGKRNCLIMSHSCQLEENASTQLRKQQNIAWCNWALMGWFWQKWGFSAISCAYKIVTAMWSRMCEKFLKKAGL